MKFKKLNSNKETNVSVAKYRIDWDKQSASKLQTSFKELLREYWENHVVCEEFVVPGSRLRFDFVNLTKKIVVEVQGAQHDSYNAFFHDGSRLKYKNSIERDFAKYNWAIQNGFKYLELKPEDLDCFSVEFVQKNFDISII